MLGVGYMRIKEGWAERPNLRLLEIMVKSTKLNYLGEGKE